MRDIADDRDFQAFKRAEALTNGEDVEKSLGRVLVGAVSCVDDGAAFETFGEELRNAGADVSHDDGVDSHRLDVFSGVDDRFTLSDATRSGGKVDDFRAESTTCESEARARSRRVFEEEVDDSLAVKERNFA